VSAAVVLTACGGSSAVKITKFGALEGGGVCEPGKGVGVGVTVDNPDGVTYGWKVTAGSVRVPANDPSAPAVTYECPNTPGSTETITVEVYKAGELLTQESKQIRVSGGTSAGAVTTPSPSVRQTAAPSASPTVTTPPSEPPDCGDLPALHEPVNGPERPGVTVRIQEPRACTKNLSAGSRLRASGSVSGLSDTLSLFVLVVNDQRQVFPQAADPCRADQAVTVTGGEWATLISLGNNIPGQGPDLPWEIVVVVAEKSSETSRQVRTYLQNACARQYEPLPRIPADATEVASIRVKTRP
jgi:hypothetical protein